MCRTSATPRLGDLSSTRVAWQVGCERPIARSSATACLDLQTQSDTGAATSESPTRTLKLECCQWSLLVIVVIQSLGLKDGSSYLRCINAQYYYYADELRIYILQVGTTRSMVDSGHTNVYCPTRNGFGVIYSPILPVSMGQWDDYSYFQKLLLPR